MRITGPNEASEDGFTLIETILAIVIISIVMLSLSAGFVTAVNSTIDQSNRQSAVQLAGDGMDRVRSVPSAALSTGRDATSSHLQWNSPLTAVTPYLSSMIELWDVAAAVGSGATAALPTTPRPVTLNNTAFKQYTYLGNCWQPTAGGACGKVAAAVTFVRVVVAVTWPQRSCAAQLCTYVTTSLVSPTGDPLFDSNAIATPPSIVAPGAQKGAVGIAGSLTLTATGGAAPITWTGSGQPTGMNTITSDGKFTGTPTAAGTFTVTVVATDAYNLNDSATFTWTVTAVPVLTNPGPQVSVVGTPVSLTLAVTGGSSPFTFTVAPAATTAAVGLPAGLTLAAATGVISGTPAAVATVRTVNATVTDSFGRTSTVAFTWTVNAPPLVLATPPAQTAEVGFPDSFTFAASGGVAPYTYTWTGQPAGLILASSTGAVSGSPTTAGTYPSVVVTVKDSLGTSTSTAKFTWTVYAALKVTYPNADITASRNQPVGDLVTATATGGAGTYTWTATNLPGDLAIRTTGEIYRIGKLKEITPGTFRVTVTVTDGLGFTASVTITVTIQ